MSHLINFSTSLSLTGCRWKLHCLFCMASLSLLSGSDIASGIFSLNLLIFSMKNLLMVVDRPAGLDTILPSLKSCVGGPPPPQPSQPLTVFQTSIEELSLWSSFCFSHSFLSALEPAVAWFLSDLNCLQSSGSSVRAAFS